MRFALTDDQAALRDAVGDLLTRECQPAVVRAAWAEDGARSEPVAAVWSKLAEMGVIGAALPERSGGLGLGACDLVPLLEEAGRVALPVPLAETAFVAAPLLAAAGDPDGLLDRLAAGELRVACALDGSAEVPFAGAADLLLVGDRPGGPVRLLDAAAAAPVISIDHARALGELTDPGAGQLLAASAEACLEAWQRGVLAAASQLIGLARALLAMSVSYACERRQFGVAIGSFQAIKHQLADILLGIEFAAPAVLRAAWSLDEGSAETDRDVAMAKTLASEAARRAAATALQAHGAIAYTTEYDLHLFAMRVWAGARSWGDADWQRSRVGAALGLDE